MAHYLPAKLPNYLLRLNVEYERYGNTIERDIISHAKFLVIEETSYDNWNGGTYGHDVKLFLPVEELGKIKIDDQSVFCKRICDDLNKVASSVENEFFNEVHLDVDDENDKECQQAIPFDHRIKSNPDALQIWRKNSVRLFISHRDNHKKKVKELAEALDNYGISSFVAHEAIAPTREWRKEIMNGLETMEIMLAFLTNDFESSIWTNQEIGFALGKNIPVISLKFEQKDPSGFIAHEQALRANAQDPHKTADKLYPLIATAVRKKDRLDDTLINSFLESPDFSETKSRFERMVGAISDLKNEQLDKIITGFEENDQLYNSVYLTSRYRRLELFLKKMTGKKYLIENGKIIKYKDASEFDDDIPF